MKRDPDRWTCLQCGFQWTPKNAEWKRIPARCSSPTCRTTYWAEARKTGRQIPGFEKWKRLNDQLRAWALKAD